ncbi:MAG: asparagine synthetase B family protein, partial [Flavobacteriales bacterium]
QFPREIDKVSLFTLFKLNYIPAPSTILKKHHKLEPGHYLEVKWDEEDLMIKKHRWYEIPYNPADEKDLSAHDYKQSQTVLKRMVRESVRKRLVADVPVGTFLSGGLDSSIITAIAKQEKKDITAYSIGFESMPYYDESNLAKKVSKHLGVDHHVFQVSENDLLESAEYILEHLDEPFGDSSILNVNVLSQKVRKDVTVALSGDGGDELFAGYHKHGAEFMLRYPRLQEHVAGKLGSLWNALPASRSGKMSNLVRQLRKFSDGYQLNSRDRYWRWAGIISEEEANYLIKEEMLYREQRLSDDAHIYKKRKDHLLRAITKSGTMNEGLLTDMGMVLANDMLFKVDHASMMHGLEVRTPLLDHHVVKFAFRLPVMFKVNHSVKKKILRDAFEELLPVDVLNAPKKGFEVPLLEWFTGMMKNKFESVSEDREFIENQNLFNVSAIEELRSKLYSKNPGDTPSIAWTFLVFQTWYKRYMV